LTYANVMERKELCTVVAGCENNGSYDF